MPRYMENPDGSYTEYGDDWTDEEIVAHHKNTVVDPHEVKTEREEARQAEIAAKSESELEEDRATVANIERLAEVDIPGYEDMPLDEKVAARQQLMWEQLNPAHKLAIGLSRSGEELKQWVGSLVGKDSKAEKELWNNAKAAENELWEMIDGFEEGGAEDIGYIIGEASKAVGTGGGATFALAKLSALGIRQGGRVLEYLAKLARPENNAPVKSLGPKAKANMLKRMKNSKSDDELAQAIAKNEAEVAARANLLRKSNDIRALNPKTAQQAAMKRGKVQQDATKQYVKEVKAGMAQKEARRLQQQKVADKFNAEKTLGIRGSAKRYQQDKTKAAVKRSPGGY